MGVGDDGGAVRSGVVVRLGRWSAGAVAAAVAWYVGMRAVFWPLQSVLADPARQSEKFLAVFFEIEPAPRTAESPWVFPVGLLVVGAAVSLAHQLRAPARPEDTLRPGALLGATAWLLMVPWFEFYLPWNVMHEPLGLVVIEAVAWAVVLLGVGLAVASTDRLVARALGWR